MSIYMVAAAAVPEKFRAAQQTEHGDVGRAWVDGLEGLLESVCRRWGLALVDVVPRHGYLSVVWQVRRHAESLALKLAVPSNAFLVETEALVVWDGRAMVRLIERDVEGGAALLQWLDASVSLAEVPLDRAVEVAGELLTVVPELDPRTADRFRAARGELTWWRRNEVLGSPFSKTSLRAAETAAERVGGPGSTSLVNHDLHYGNVVRDWDSRWVCIDPKPLIGPPEYGLAPLIWRRYRGPDDSIERTKRLCEIARLDENLGFDWLLVRTVDYALWALEAGLTTDPELCLELVDRLT